MSQPRQRRRCCLFDIPRTAIEDASGPALVVGLLTAVVVFFFSSHASQRPKEGIDRLRTDPASLFKNAWTWAATTAAVSTTPLVGKTVRLKDDADSGSGSGPAGGAKLGKVIAGEIDGVGPPPPSRSISRAALHSPAAPRSRLFQPKEIGSVRYLPSQQKAKRMSREGDGIAPDELLSNK